MYIRPKREREKYTGKQKRKRNGLALDEKKERQRIKRSVEMSGFSRLHGFVEPPCYYTDYIFKCAYPGCVLSPTLPVLSSPPFLSRLTMLRQRPTIRRVLSIFSRLHGFYDTFVAVFSRAGIFYFTRYGSSVPLFSSA